MDHMDGVNGRDGLLTPPALEVMVVVDAEVEGPLEDMERGPMVVLVDGLVEGADKFQDKNAGPLRANSARQSHGVSAGQSTSRAAPVCLDKSAEMSQSSSAGTSRQRNVLLFPSSNVESSVTPLPGAKSVVKTLTTAGNFRFFIEK